MALVYVPTAFMVADIMTKSLCYELHARHTAELKGVEMPVKETKAKRTKRKKENESDMNVD